MISIEPYSDAYYLDVVRVVQNFHSEAVKEYDDFFDADSVIKKIDELKETQRENAFLLVINGQCEGLLFGVVVNSLINDKLIYQEVIWYVNERYRRYGVKLLKTAQDRLRAKGVKIMIMAALANSKSEKLDRFYSRLGFKPMEIHYTAAL